MTEHRFDSEWRCDCPSCVKEQKASPAEALRVREAQRERHRHRRSTRSASSQTDASATSSTDAGREATP